jgi:hypothetical protein
MIQEPNSRSSFTPVITPTADFEPRQRLLLLRHHLSSISMRVLVLLLLPISLGGVVLQRARHEQMAQFRRIFKNTQLFATKQISITRMQLQLPSSIQESGLYEMVRRLMRQLLVSVFKIELEPSVSEMSVTQKAEAVRTGILSSIEKNKFKYKLLQASNTFNNKKGHRIGEYVELPPSIDEAEDDELFLSDDNNASVKEFIEQEDKEPETASEAMVAEEEARAENLRVAREQTLRILNEVRRGSSREEAVSSESDTVTPPVSVKSGAMAVQAMTSGSGVMSIMEGIRSKSAASGEDMALKKAREYTMRILDDLRQARELADQRRLETPPIAAAEEPDNSICIMAMDATGGDIAVSEDTSSNLGLSSSLQADESLAASQISSTEAKPFEVSSEMSSEVLPIEVSSIVLPIEVSSEVLPHEVSSRKVSPHEISLEDIFTPLTAVDRAVVVATVATLTVDFLLLLSFLRLASLLLGQQQD